MPDKENLLVLLFCPAFFTVTALWGAVHHLYALGKSKTRIAKERKTIPFIKKLLLLGYAQKCEYHASKAKCLCFLWWGYLLLTMLCVVFWIISNRLPAFEQLFSIAVYVKVIAMDVPINVYGFIMTRYGKNGGSIWVWTKNE